MLVMRIVTGGTGRLISLPEMNARVNELLKQSIKSDGVINLFSDVKEEFSLFDPEFLMDIAKMKHKNLAVEVLRNLIDGQVSVYKRTNVVKSEEFSEIIKRTMNKYINGLISNEEVIQELLELAKKIRYAKDEGVKLGLNSDELAFYDALTKPEAIRDFQQNKNLISLTKELTNMLRRNRTVDWTLRESARAKMRIMVRKLLKKYKYPPEGQEDAVKTVIAQCEMWADNSNFYECKDQNTDFYRYRKESGCIYKAADLSEQYGVF